MSAADALAGAQWEVWDTEPGAWASPRELPADAGMPATVPGTAAAVVRAARGPDAAAALDYDGRDWWWRTRVVLRGWHFERSGTAQAGVYRARLASDSAGYAIDLELAATQPVLLQGEAGFSRKGPELRQASHYYSEPHLAASGRLVLAGQEAQGNGRAWMDHEWSDEILAGDAVGWDWIGINFFDGSALTAFVLRRADGSVACGHVGRAVPAHDPLVVAVCARSCGRRQRGDGRVRKQQLLGREAAGVAGAQPGATAEEGDLETVRGRSLAAQPSGGMAGRQPRRPPHRARTDRCTGTRQPRQHWHRLLGRSE